MSRTLAAAVACLVATAIVGTPITALAADRPDDKVSLKTEDTTPATAVEQVLPWYRGPQPRAAGDRPAALPMLYVSLGALQATDLYTTRVGLKHGASEANPLLTRTASNQGTMIAVKLATTAGTIALCEKLWKTNRTAAIALMIGVNGMMAGVAARNVQVIRGLKK